MMRLIVLRPPERAAATMARIAEAGGEAINLPLFALEPLAWNAPDSGEFEALALTSANAVRLAGAQLSSIAALPAWTVGEATAAAARDADLSVAHIGASDATALFAEMAEAGVGRALWLAGEDRRPAPSAPLLTVIETYRTEPLAIDTAQLLDSVALIHSPRAAARLAELVTPSLRVRIHLAAISETAANAGGAGWASITVAPQPSDTALVAAAIDRARAHADKRPR